MNEETRRLQFEAAYRSTYQAVTGYVLRRSSDHHDASDVIAETYLTLWRRFDDAPDGEMCLPWLYGVARRLLANHRRGEARRTAATTRLAQSLRTLPSAIAETRLPAAGIGRALDRLSPADRELLLLMGAEGLSREQLAVALDVSRAVVRLRVFRARNRFARELAAEGIELDRASCQAPSAASITSGVILAREGTR